MKRNFIALLLVVFTAPVALAQDENLSWSVTEVEPGLYMFEGLPYLFAAGFGLQIEPER